MPPLFSEIVSWQLAIVCFVVVVFSSAVGLWQNKIRNAVFNDASKLSLHNSIELR